MEIRRSKISLSSTTLQKSVHTFFSCKPSVSLELPRTFLLIFEFHFWPMSLFSTCLMCILEKTDFWSKFWMKENIVWWVEIMLAGEVNMAFRKKDIKVRMESCEWKEANCAWNLFYSLCQKKKREKEIKEREKKRRKKFQGNCIPE